MEANNLNILVEAKKEYLGQLCSIMCPMMIEKFEDMYTETRRNCKNRKVLLHYQKALKDVTDWNDHTVKQIGDNLTNRCSWFSDLLAAVFVSFIKILSSVRLNTNKAKISVKLPSNHVFIHGCFIAAAKDLYKDPYVYHEELSEYDRDVKLYKRFTECIESTVKDMLPVQDILKTYISNQDSAVSMDTEDLQDTEDPELLDALEPQEPEIPEESEEPEVPEVPEEPEEPEVPEVPEEPEMPEGAEPDPEEITKLIGIRPKGQSIQVEEEDDVLFSDAPEQDKKS